MTFLQTIELLRELEAKATRADWFEHQATNEITFHNPGFGVRRVGQVDMDADLAFIVQARNALPLLLKFVTDVQNVVRLAGEAKRALNDGWPNDEPAIFRRAIEKLESEWFK